MNHVANLETRLITPEDVKAWKSPPCQREITVNSKVRQEASSLASSHDGVIPGIVHLGAVDGDTTTYVVDGKQRINTFLLSGRSEAIVDTRMKLYGSMADLSRDFRALHQHWVPMKPNDMLRAVEQEHEPFAQLLSSCSVLTLASNPSSRGAVRLKASTALRAWEGSRPHVPIIAGSGNAERLALAMTSDGASECARFYNTLDDAWGRDPEYRFLWRAMNLVILGWLWRRIVLTQHGKSVQITVDTFRKCSMALSADGRYLEWLAGRNPADEQRAPCYRKVKERFAATLRDVMGKGVLLPDPDWTKTT